MTAQSIDGTGADRGSAPGERIRNALSRWWPPAAVLVVGVVLWQVAVVVSDVSPLLFAGPTAVIQAFMVEAQGPLFGALRESMVALGWGVGVGTLVGVGLGLVLGISPRLGSLVAPYLWAGFATPNIALAPLVILWFGLGDQAKIALALLAALAPVALNVKEGVENIDPDLIDVGYSFGGRRRSLYGKVVVPLIVPSIATGVRSGLARGFVSVLIVEMLTGTGGLGTQVLFALDAFDSARMLAYVLFVVALAIVIISASRALEARVSKWREEVSV